MKRMVDLPMGRQRIGEWTDGWVDEEWKYECVFVHMYECMMKGEMNI